MTRKIEGRIARLLNDAARKAASTARHSPRVMLNGLTMRIRDAWHTGSAVSNMMYGDQRALGGHIPGRRGIHKSYRSLTHVSYLLWQGRNEEIGTVFYEVLNVRCSGYVVRTHLRMFTSLDVRAHAEMYATMNTTKLDWVWTQSDRFVCSSERYDVSTLKRKEWDVSYLISGARIKGHDAFLLP